MYADSVPKSHVIEIIVLNASADSCGAKLVPFSGCPFMKADTIYIQSKLGGLENKGR